MRPGRTRALQAGCPKCGAPAGVACEGKKGARLAPHKARLHAPIATRVPASTPEPPSFYHTPEWRRVRYQALKKHGGACQCCGRTASRGHPLHVDHIKPRSKFPELELDLNNLQVLCEDCNLGKSAWDQTDWRGEGKATLQ
jgi:hypothetical protein